MSWSPLRLLRDGFAAYPRAFWVLWVGTFVNRMGLVVLPFLTLYLTVERGLRPSIATALVAGFGLGAFVANFAGGVLADRWGRRPVLLAGLFGGAVLIALVPWVHALPLLAGLVVLLGLVTESYRPAVSAAIVDLVEEEQRTQAFALFYWVINIGAAVAPALAGFLAARSYGLLFALDAATMAVYGLLLLVAFAETRPDTDSPNSSQASALRPARALDAVRDPVLLGLAACTLLLASLMFLMYTVFPLVFSAQGLSETDYGLIAGTNGAVIVVLSLPLAQVIKRQPPYPVLVVAGLLYAAGFALHLPASTLGGHALAVAVWTLGEIALVTMAPVLVAQLSPESVRGAYMGVYGAAWGLAHMVSPPLGGLVFERPGVEALWIGSVGVALAGTVGFVLLGWAARGTAERGFRENPSGPI
ncbi:MAG: MFS transporter [Bacteroidota bacterium]